MEARFIDNRGDQKSFWQSDIEAIPRQGDLVFLCYNDNCDSGAWRVVEVDWNYFTGEEAPSPYVDIFCEPYEGEDWKGTADAQLVLMQRAEAILDDQGRELPKEEP